MFTVLDFQIASHWQVGNLKWVSATLAFNSLGLTKFNTFSIHSRINEVFVHPSHTFPQSRSFC